MGLPSFVGRYEIREEIARGGFAVVVKAWDGELDSLVALKILHPHLADDAAIEHRFLQEARLLRRVSSPHVVTVHDVGRLNDGRPYFVLDFADRGTLGSRLTARALRRPLSGRCLIPLVDAMAEGLGAIHQAGLVHRDVKPDNILFQQLRRIGTAPPASPSEAATDCLLDDDERVIVGDLGIAKDTVSNGVLPTIVGGSPLYLAPEQNLPSAEVTAAADVYGATAVLWHVVTGQPPPLPGKLDEHLGGTDPAWHPVMRQGLATDPVERHAGMEAWRFAVQDALERVATDTRTLDVAREGQCPYKGLAAYQQDDAQFFCGRETLVDELVRRVQLHQVLVVGGPSGSGKSSLVRAGLLPALRAGVLPGSEQWQIVVISPGRDPVNELLMGLKACAPDAPAFADTDSLEREPARIVQLVESHNLAQRATLIFVDQFEELFTLATPAARDNFLAILSSVTDLAESRVKLVVAVRADFYNACAQIPWLAGRITNNQVLVGPMTPADLRRAISEPARRASLYLEQGLVEAVMEEAGSEAGSLPLMAHALVETWVRRRGNMLTLEGFRAAGGVAGAISQTADATFEHQLDDAGREATKRLFLRLVTTSEGVPETRRSLPRSEIDLDQDADTMHRVIEQLTKARLLSVDDDRIQITHEALLRTWPRLRGWIEESRDDLRMRQKISHAAMEWDTEQRQEDLLYRGIPLLTALEWQARNPGQLGRLERDFLAAAEASKARRDAIAEEKRRRSRRWRRAAVAMLAALTIGTSLSSLLAYRSANNAREHALRADAASVQAQERFATALGSAAFGHVREDPRLALALAAEAMSRSTVATPTYDTRAAIIAARRSLAEGHVFLLGSPVPASDALAITMSPDGTLLAIGQADGRIGLYDTRTRRERTPKLEGHEGAVRSLEFIGSGEHLVSAGVDGTIRLWPSLNDGIVAPRLLGRIDDIVMDVCVHPGNAIVATAGADGTVRLWDTAGLGTDRAPLARLPLEFNTLEFSHDGDALLAATNDARIHAWSIATGKPVFPPIDGVHSGHLLAIDMHPDGRYAATVSTDGTSALIAFPEGRVAGRPFARDATIGTAMFDADGALLIGGDERGRLRLWQLDDSKEIQVTPSGHSQPIIDASLSDDGHLLATLGRDQTIRFWTLGDDHPLAKAYATDGGKVRSVAYSPDGRHLAVGDSAGGVRLWQTTGDLPAHELTRHDTGVWALHFSPASDLLLSSDRNGVIRLTDMVSGQTRHEIVTDGAVWSLALLDEGRTLVAATDQGLSFWALGSPAEARVIHHPTGRVTRLAISPGEDLVATSSTDGHVRLYDVATGKLSNELAVDGDTVWSLAFSPDGRQLATASGSETVAVWDLPTGEQRALFSGHTGGATDVVFLSDGVTLAATDRSGNLHWWDLETRRQLTPPIPGHAGSSWRMTVHPDGRTLATAGDDGSAKTWDLLDIDSACRLGRPGFDQGRRRQYLGSADESAACDPPAPGTQPQR